MDPTNSRYRCASVKKPLPVSQLGAPPGGSDVTTRRPRQYSSVCIIHIAARYLCHLRHFYPNVTTLRSGLCYRKSVCLSVVCNVCAPYSGRWNFRQYLFAISYVSHPLTEILRTSSQGNPFVGGVTYVTFGYG